MLDKLRLLMAKHSHLVFKASHSATQTEVGHSHAFAEKPQLLEKTFSVPDGLLKREA